MAATEQAERPSKFSCDGLIEVDVGLAVEGFGPVKLPLRPAAGRMLAQVARQAPYGKRTKTILDTNVRDAIEIAADAVRFSDSFNHAIQVAAGEVASALRLDQSRLEVDLYKLLIYLNGGFFLPHRDSEKRRGMVATMIVVLPSKFGGGELIVEHAGRRKQYRFDAARSQSAAQYAAFFADCQHEVKNVTSGVRVSGFQSDFEAETRPPVQIRIEQRPAVASRSRRLDAASSERSPGFRLRAPIHGERIETEFAQRC